MKRYFSYFSALLCVALLAVAAGCSEDTAVTETTVPATALIETKATGGDGAPVALSDYRLYGYKGDGTAALLDMEFQPGKPVDITDLSTLVAVATHGDGTAYNLPDGTATLDASVITCPTRMDGDILATPFPYLYVKAAKVSVADKQVTLQMECRNCRINVAVADTGSVAMALVLTVADMPCSLRLSDGLVEGKAVLELPLTRSDNVFTGTAICLPPTSEPTFRYELTRTDGGKSTGSFTAGSFERGKAYTLNLYLASRDDRITIETATIIGWTPVNEGNVDANEEEMD